MELARDSVCGVSFIYPRDIYGDINIFSLLKKDI
jgi:hypothetical protein